MSDDLPTLMLSASRQFGAFGFFAGFLAGIAYGIGGWIVDMSTTGINEGSFLALNALWAMPILFTPFGVIAGVLWAPFWHMLPEKLGGRAGKGPES